MIRAQAYLHFSGAIGQAFTSDRFGRKGSIIIWAAIFTVGVAIQTGTEYSIVQITVGRFVAGLGVGAMSGLRLFIITLLFAHEFVAIVPLYNGETSPKAIRGMMLVMYQLQIVMGWAPSYPLQSERRSRSAASGYS